MPDSPDPLPDSDATIPVAGPAPSIPRGDSPDLPLPEELTALLPGGNYLVESFLGQGGMGAVYKGTQIRLKRPVAVKIMRRDQGKDYGFEQRFEREAQAMAKLNHPNIVSVIDYGEAGPDYLYIVMELIDGADLMDVIRGGQMTQEMALMLLPQVCDALQFAHDHGIVHRDIKPSNIMLTRDGRVKMCDFGLAKPMDAVESSFRTQTGTGMGTPDYAAPEQFDSHAHIDHRADIYALGVMIYQMITGQLPRGVWKPPSQRAEIAPQWDDIVSRAMQSDPKDRYQQASEVKTDVSSIPLAQGRVAGPSAAANGPQAALGGPSALPRSKSRAPLLAGIATTAIVLSIVAFFALRDSSPRSGGFHPPSKTPDTQPASANKPSPGSAPPTPTPAVGNTPLLAQPLPESGWQQLFAREKWKPPVHLTTNSLFRTELVADRFIRARIRWQAGSAKVGLLARSTRDGVSYILELQTSDTVRLSYGSRSDNITVLGSHSLPKPLQAGDTALLELHIQGDRLSALVDGAMVIEARDARLPGPGLWGIIAGDGWYETVEVQTPKPATPAAATQAAKQTLDLIALVDVKRDRLKAEGNAGANVWTKSGGQLVFTSGDKRAGKIAAPVALNGLRDYEIEVGVSSAAPDAIGIDLPMSATNQATIAFVPGQVVLLRDGNTSNVFGNWPKEASSPPWKLATRIKFDADGVNGTISATVNGTAMGEWRGALTKLRKTTEPHPDFPGQLVPALYIPSGDRTHTSWSLRTFDGEAKVLRGVVAEEPWRDWIAETRSSGDLARFGFDDDGEQVRPRAPSGPSWPHKLTARDGVIRALWKLSPEIPGMGEEPYVALRLTEGGDLKSRSKYAAVIRAKDVCIKYLDLDKSGSLVGLDITRWPLPPGYDRTQEHTLEFRAVGDLLTVSLAGEFVGSVRHSALSSGGFGMFAAKGATIQKIEYLSLDPKTGAASTSPSLPASALPALPESGWKPLVSKEEWETNWEGAPFNYGGKLVLANRRFNKEGLLHMQGTSLYKPSPSADGAIRVESVIRQLPHVINLGVRRRSGDQGRYAFGMGKDGNSLLMRYITTDAATWGTLQSCPLPTPLKIGDRLKLELRIQGSQITGLCNGVAVLQAQDQRLTAAGEWGLDVVDATIQSVEVQSLPAAASPKIIRLFDTADKLPKRPGVSFGQFNTLKLENATVGTDTPSARDVIFRTSLKLSADNGGGAYFVVRYQEKKQGYILASSGEGKVIELRLDQGGNVRMLQSWPVPKKHQPDDWLLLEIKAIGAQLTVSLADEVLGTVEDASLMEAGGVRVGALRTGYFKDIEYMPLDAPAVSPSPSLPASKSSVLTFNGHRYQLISAPSTWAEAKARAETMGGYLTTFTTEAEELWARDHFFTPLSAQESSLAMTGFDKLYWVGARVAAQSHDLRWLSGEPVGKLRWRGGNPDWREKASLKETQTAGGPLFAAGVTVHQPLATGEWAAIQPEGPVQRTGFIIEWDDAGGTPAAQKAASEKWVDVLAKILAKGPGDGSFDALTKVADGAEVKRRDPPIGIPLGPRSDDIAVRVRVRGIKGTVAFSLRGDGGIATGDMRSYIAHLRTDGSGVIQRRDANDKLVKLADFPAIPAFDKAATHTVEFRAEGDLLTLRVDGQTLGTVRDATFAKGGTAYFVGDPGMVIEALEYLDLDDDPPAAVPPSGTKDSAVSGGKWVDVLAAEWARPENKRSNKIVKAADGARILDKGPYYFALAHRNLAMRAVLRGGDTGELFLNLRSLNGGYSIILDQKGQGRLLLGLIKPGEQSQQTELAKFTLPAGFSLADRHTAEFRVYVDELTFSLDGQELVRVRDRRKASGNASIEGKGVLIEKLETLDLGPDPILDLGSAAATAPTGSEQWVDGLAEWWAVPANAASGLLVKEAEGSRLSRDLSPSELIAVGSGRNVAVRATFRFEGTDYWGLIARKTGVDEATNFYSAGLKKDATAILRMNVAGVDHVLRHTYVPGFHTDRSHTLEFRVHGDVLTITLNGKVVARARDDTFKDTGAVAFNAKAGALIEKLEYCDLGADPPAAPLEKR